MIRWLVIALFIYLMLRLISGPKRTTGRTSRINIQFGNRPTNRTSRPKRTSIEQIEEAEYEDITDLDESKRHES